MLICDDSRIVCASIIKHIKDAFDIREAIDGEAGWAALNEDETIQVLISDLSMPKLDGFALLAEIKRSASLSTIPVVVASTRCDPETRRRILELGAQALLSKPVEPWELARVVEPLQAGVSA